MVKHCRLTYCDGGLMESFKGQDGNWYTISQADLLVFEALEHPYRFTYKRKMHLLVKLSQDPGNFTQLVKHYFPLYIAQLKGADVVMYDYLHYRLKEIHNIIKS